MSITLMSYSSWSSIDVDVERRLFEKQAKKVGAHLGALPDGTYSDPSTSAAFNGWLLAKEDVVQESSGTADNGEAVERVRCALQRLKSRMLDLMPAMGGNGNASLALDDARKGVARSLQDLRRVQTSLQTS